MHNIITGLLVLKDYTCDIQGCSDMYGESSIRVYLSSPNVPDCVDTLLLQLGWKKAYVGANYAYEYAT